ncbi:MAG: TonB-dependent receptor, partial [Gemmatimonadetes bacterium]|nr:TonB-dependent receptor [Gemmatimonadota bacterium]
AAVLYESGAARAQHPPEPSGVLVMARDAETGDAVVGARVYVGTGHGGLTDGRGGLRVAGLGAGTYTVRVTHHGYEAYVGEVRVGPDGLGGHEARLVPRAVTLAEVSVERRPGPRTGFLQRFYDRAERGGGSYFTREQIDRMDPRRVTDLFRLLPGLLVAQTPGGEGLMRVDGNAARLEGARTGPPGGLVECPVLYFIDGTPVQVMPGGSIDHEIRPSEIEGIEVYRRATTAPPEFRRPGANCGIVLIWKRERIGGA